mmetsp:Transcript_20440/g.44126  ORF Transcript_20440/g.44126 Transcript_20440/m.44126 type:complete len:111 (-) Transcript_20440:938-1270(-)
MMMRVLCVLRRWVAAKWPLRTQTTPLKTSKHESSFRLAIRRRRSLNPKKKPCPFGFRLAGFSVASLEFSHSALNLEEKSTSDIKQLAQLINSLDRRYVHRQFNCNITNPS